jgi:hypothetical protein
MAAEAGIVKIQAWTIRPAKPHRTALKLFREPIPTIDPAIVWVVLTEIPKYTSDKKHHRPTRFGTKTIHRS